MTLKFVTWDGDLTQFLVNAETEDKAIYKAIDANFKICAPDDDIIEDMKNQATYEVEDVDFDLLCEIFQRTDCIGVYGEAVVFNN